MSSINSFIVTARRVIASQTITKQLDPPKRSAFHELMSSIDPEYDLALLGGRGGAKSMGAALLCLDKAIKYAENYHGLYIRKTYKGIADFQTRSNDIFKRGFQSGVNYNKQEGLYTFSNGATLELGQLTNAKDYDKYLGRSFTDLILDECGQYPEPFLLDRLSSNLRGPIDMPLRIIWIANPGGVGHQWLAKRYVYKKEPGVPFTEEETERTVVYLHSTYLDNPFIDQAKYLKVLRAANAKDPELLKAEVKGDWSINRGAYFAHCLEENRNLVEAWEALPIAVNYIDANSRPNVFNEWQYRLTMDYGSAKPAAIYVLAEAIEDNAYACGRNYHLGSIVVIDELYTSRPGSLNEGLGWQVKELSEAIVKMASIWGIDDLNSNYNEHIADSSIFAEHGSNNVSIAAEFEDCGIIWNRSRKGSRVAGWQLVKKMLLAADSNENEPGLYFARNCTALWNTLPNLPRSNSNPEDVDTNAIDHAGDAIRYGLLGKQPR